MNFPQKVKKVIQIVDATASIEESDQHHGGRTTIKRKQMVTLQTQQERDEYEAERLDRQDAKRMKRYGTTTDLGDLDQVEMASLRGEINEMTKGKMTKQQRRQLEKEKLTKVGAVVHEHKHARRNLQRQTTKQLKQDVEYYKSQAEIGMAVGLVNPLQAHRKKMEGKYDGPKTKGIKLHTVGKMEKDGSLTIGKHAMRRTENKLRDQRSGGSSANSLFKKMKK